MIEQIDIFSDEIYDKFKTKFERGDYVKVNLSEEYHFEAYNYFKYYQPEVLNAKGTVIDVDGDTIKLEIKGKLYILKEDEIILLN